MFSTVRYFIKTSLASLFVGIIIGLSMTVVRHLLDGGLPPDLISAHAHGILVGSVMMMIMGVALWHFPKMTADDKRHDPERIRVSYWMITVATAVRFVTQTSVGFVEARQFRWMIVAASIFQVVAFGVSFFSLWGRIRAAGSALREAYGEQF